MDRQVVTSLGVLSISRFAPLRSPRMEIFFVSYLFLDFILSRFKTLFVSSCWFSPVQNTFCFLLILDAFCFLLFLDTFRFPPVSKHFLFSPVYGHFSFSTVSRHFLAPEWPRCKTITHGGLWMTGVQNRHSRRVLNDFDRKPWLTRGSESLRSKTVSHVGRQMTF